jgi:hypothetical protein
MKINYLSTLTQTDNNYIIKGLDDNNYVAVSEVDDVSQICGIEEAVPEFLVSLDKKIPIHSENLHYINESIKCPFDHNPDECEIVQFT